MVDLQKIKYSFLRLKLNRVLVFLCLFFSLHLVAKTETAPLLSTISTTNLDSEGCCFQLNYNYDGALGDVDALETRILTPNVLFSSVQFPITSGWSYDELLTQRRLRWSYSDGHIPLGEQTLTDLCFSGWNTSSVVELLVIWRQGNFIRQRDTLRIECTQCWEAQNPMVNCEADSSYTYTFDYANLSEFQVDYLQIRERNGQDFVIEQNIVLSQSLQTGEIATTLLLHFRPESVNEDEICFEITPRHFLQDSIAIECCTAEYCVPIPICDRCCTDYLTFEEEVEQGFTIEVNCENESVRLQANALNECDRVQFDITNLGAGIISGNEAVTFGGLNEDNTYDICMTATRRDLNGENCYEEASLEICDQFTFDCITESLVRIDLLEGGKIYPNPTNEQLHLELPIQGERSFEVWNSIGQHLLTSQTDFLGQAHVLTDQWSAGYYYITAYIGTQSLWRKAFIIER